MNENKFQTYQSKTESDVIDFYDKYAPDWDRRFESGYSTDYFLESRFKHFYHFIDKYSLQDKVAVELGVGTGVYISRCAKIFSKIIAVDGSNRMLGELKLKIAESNIENTILLNSNVLEMREIEPEFADVVYFFGLLEHVLSADKFLGEMRRILKLGGVVIGITPNAKSPWYGSWRRNMRGTDKHCASDKYYTVAELRELATRNSFRLVDYEYWGAVPAGMPNGLMLQILKLADRLLPHTFFKSMLGGITFVIQK